MEVCWIARTNLWLMLWSEEFTELNHHRREYINWQVKSVCRGWCWQFRSASITFDLPGPGVARCKLGSLASFVLYIAQASLIINSSWMCIHTHPHTHSHRGVSRGSMTAVWAMSRLAWGSYHTLTCLIVCVPRLPWQVCVHTVPVEKGSRGQCAPLHLLTQTGWPKRSCWSPC